jgi:hypothetical protein
MATSKKNIDIPCQKFDFWERHENRHLHKVLSRDVVLPPHHPTELTDDDWQLSPDIYIR